MLVVGPVEALFPPQDRDWGLLGEVPLTPWAARRVGREGASQTFGKAAAALNEDWGTQLDGKQVQRWAETLGQALVRDRQTEVLAFEQGHRPASPPNAPILLVIGVDGGRVQSRHENADTGSRWREDKVATITTYLTGNEAEKKKPQPLVTSYVATMAGTESFGKMVRVEAERRGLSKAGIVLAIGDGGNWIDPLFDRERLYDRRIIDYYHAVEHLYEAARSALGKDSPEAVILAEQLKSDLWHGRVDDVIATLQEHSAGLGPPQSEDGPNHPRRVLANNVGYFKKHRHHMAYADYRRRGWPIGSGGTEAGVKQFNKRVKGTDQFWNESGVEAILALRALWLCQDERWSRYWSTRSAYSKAA